MTTFAIAALLLIMVPGPDQALITRNALVGGRRAGVMTMLGGVLGVTVHATAAAAGLSALLLTSATAFTALKIVGAAYLCGWACRCCASAVRSGRERVELVPEANCGAVRRTSTKASCPTRSTPRSRCSS